MVTKMTDAVVKQRHPDAYDKTYLDGSGVAYVHVWSSRGKDKAWLGAGRYVDSAWRNARANVEMARKAVDAEAVQAR